MAYNIHLGLHISERFCGFALYFRNWLVPVYMFPTYGKFHPPVMYIHVSMPGCSFHYYTMESTAAIKLLNRKAVENLLRHQGAIQKWEKNLSDCQ